MRRIAVAVLALCSIGGSAEARTLFTSPIVCVDGGGFTQAVKGTVLFHFGNGVATVKARLDGLTPGATVAAGYVCTIDGVGPAGTTPCPSAANNAGKLACAVSFPAPTSCAGASPFIVVAPSTECGPGFVK